jgi:hypothetical protein
MKRSEMIEKLRDYFFDEEENPDPFSGFSKKFIEDFSDSILTFLERQGMQPPAYMEKTAPGWPAIRKNEWEPEDDQH